MKSDDDYLLKAWFGSLLVSVCGVGGHRRGSLRDRQGLQRAVGSYPGEVSRDLTEAWKGDPRLEALAERYKAFVTERNHLAHSHPATDNEDRGSSRRLYR